MVVMWYYSYNNVAIYTCSATNNNINMYVCGRELTFKFGMMSTDLQ